MPKVATADFVRRATETHDGRYDYSKSVYTKTLDKIEIICPVHGSFWQQAGQHMLGQTCAKCYHDSMRKTDSEFIREALAIHGPRYDYSRVVYRGYRKSVAIVCSAHGEFSQRVDKHLMGHGCPKCVSTMTSSVSTEWIDSLQLPTVVLEYHIPTTRYHADAFCPSTNTIYEFYGDFWHGHPSRYDPTAKNAIKNKTFGQLYSETMQREELIISLGYNLVTIWETEWNQLRKLMSKQNELTRTLTMIEVGKPVSEEQAMQLIEYVAALEALCDEADMDDCHGTEGWRHHLGMDN